jgi:3-isopropylmalate/(R)-2-methylmalate dehydratase small subunit
MTPFTTLTSIVAPLIRDNVDTDTIIPSREMKSTGRTGLADGLFAPWRYTEGRTPDPVFMLNQPAFADAQILASGANFGCGSSREHAVWALAEWGIRAVIAESFAPIFRNNCVRNGVLPVVLPRDAIAQLAGQAVTIDLAAQTVDRHSFDIDAEAKTMLLEGLDAIDLTLKHRESIARWTTQDRTARPWVYLPPQAKLGEGTREAQLRGGGVTTPRLTRSNAGVMRARKLRRDLSPPERRLWSALRERPGGLKFRCQHPADPYTLDFYCPAARLCIEIDGEAHNRGDRPQRDERRDQFLERYRIATIRIPAAEIMRNLDGAVRHIVHAASERIPLHPDASHRGSPPHSANGEEE